MGKKKGNLQAQVKSVEETYGIDNLHLKVAKGLPPQAPQQCEDRARAVPASPGISDRVPDRRGDREPRRGGMKVIDGEPEPDKRRDSGRRRTVGRIERGGMTANPLGAH